jgi:hypothetical protein
MPFGFLVPAFLAGLAALAVPILLHLRHKDRDRPLRFPSLMFLEKLPIRTERRQRLSDLPLLLLRALALALLVMAFARPVLKDKAANAGDTRSRAVVVLIDRSMSMGYEGVWPRALDSARAVIAGLGNGDRVAVVAYDDAAEVLQRITPDKAAATASLSRLVPVRRGTRLAPALRTARQLLLDAPFAAAEVVVISDLQRAGAAGIGTVELPTGVKVRGISLSVTSSDSSWVNSAVRTVEARRVREGDRTMLAVKARVQSHGLPELRPVAATLTVNGREAATARVTLARDGETVVTFTPVPAPDDAVSLRVQLPADKLAADDTLVAVVPRDDALRVAMVTPSDIGGDETLFLERAMTIGRAPSVQVDKVAMAPASDESLARTGVVLFWDVLPSPNDALTRWLDKGGGVVIVAGRRLAARRGDLPGIVPVRMSGLADRLSDRGGTLREMRMEHPLFVPFRDAPDALGAVRFWRYPRMDVRGTADVLARFDDGLPAVVEQRVGDGRTVLLATPLDNQGGDFPLQPAFLPFLRQLALHASGRDATPLWRLTGESWSLPSSLRDPVVTSPNGALMRPQTDSMGTAVPLADAGIYTAFRERATGTPAAVLAVNVAPSESELTPMDTSELLLGVRSAAAGDSAGVTSSAPATVEELERRQNPWRYLLMFAVLLLATETLLATRGRRGTARRVALTRQDGPTRTTSAEELR